MKLIGKIEIYALGDIMYIMDGNVVLHSYINNGRSVYFAYTGNYCKTTCSYEEFLEAERYYFGRNFHFHEKCV